MITVPLQVLGGKPLGSLEKQIGNLEPVLDVFEKHFIGQGGFVNGMSKVSVQKSVGYQEPPSDHLRRPTPQVYVYASHHWVESGAS